MTADRGQTDRWSPQRSEPQQPPVQQRPPAATPPLPSGTHTQAPRHTAPPSDAQVGRGTPLASSGLTRDEQPIPSTGWRRWLRAATGERVNPGISRQEAEYQELVARITQPLNRPLKVAIICGKGGIAKTTTTVGVGSVLAEFRPHPVCAADFNPDFGTLGVRVPNSRSATIRDLINFVGQQQSLTATAAERFANPNQHRLAVFKSGRSDDEITRDEYLLAMQSLQDVYPLCLFDTGTSLTTPVHKAILSTVDQIVFVASYSIDEATASSEAVLRIRERGGRHKALVDNAIVAITNSSGPQPVQNVKTQDIDKWFREATNKHSMHLVPWDAHVKEGGVLDLNRVSRPTRIAYMKIAADIIDNHLGNPLPSQSPSGAGT